MKVSIQKLLSLLTVLSICAGMFLTGCNTPGNADESVNDPTPSPSEATDQTEPSALPQKERTISAQKDTAITADWTEVGKYSLDLHGDKRKETVALFVHTQKDGKGNLQRDDGQEWILRVESDGKYYTLFEEYVQNGNVYFEVSDYYAENTVYPVITLVKSTGAEFKLIQYSFVKEQDVFAEKVLYDSAEHSKDGINRRYSSIPEVE